MAPMPDFSLFRPMQGLPWYLVPIWPLIFLRIQRLRAWFRANGAPGSQMLWAVTNHGRVDVVFLSDDMSVHPSCSFRAPVSDRLGRALAGETIAPCPLRRQGRRIPARRTHAHQSALGIRLSREKPGPIPDT
tara:strand:- start:6947 stop:7342 length:396 start_codon:yes stop_codon:yes gene_type:complete